MRTYAVYLWPRGALASEIGSDTLFGAVCWAIRLLGLADVGELLAGFSPPRFAFSSPFPVYRSGGERVRFYARPTWLDPTPADLDRVAADESLARPGANPKEVKLRLVDSAKIVAGASFVSEELFGQITSGATDARTLMERILARSAQDGKVERADSALITRTERLRVEARQPLKNLMRRTAVLHNQIDRVAGATAEGLLFYTNELHFAEGAGLWCLVRASDADAEGLIRPALRYLADTGLGADRTSGKGHFAIEMTDAPALPDAGASANGWLTLSRYLPEAGEWSPSEGPLAYRLTNLWAKRDQRYPPAGISRTSPVYKRRLRVFEPGSTFPLGPRKEIYGRLAPVAEGGWTTYQSGLAIGVAVRVPADREGI
jgi:CRISPR-associated protein Csm4